MKILISGGWGYSNLGDDAILISTIKSIYKVIPSAEITVLSFNVEETYLNIHELFPNIPIIKSLHATLFTKVNYPTNTNFISNLRYKILKKISSKYNTKLASKILQKEERILNEIIQKDKAYDNIFKSTDLYLMSGGGYLNDWIDMGCSKLLEVLHAKKYNKPVILLGQTVGPFHNNLCKNTTKRIISLADKKFFRDYESIKEFDEISSTSFIPDIALSDIYRFNKKNYITIIPFNKEILLNLDLICLNLKQLSIDSGCEIIITVSQEWPWTIKYAQIIEKKLRKIKVQATFINPQTVLELQQILGKSKLVISQNLHGLIIGYRSITPVISLNGRRKFQAFMKMINAQECIILPQNINNQYCFTELYRKASQQINYIESFQAEIHKIFHEIFKPYGC